MSLKPSDNMMIPADTVRVARAIYPRDDNLWIKMRDELGPIFDDEQYREGRYRWSGNESIVME